MAHETIEALRPYAVLSSEILAQDKAELIETVEETYETFGPFLMDLAEGGKTACALMEMIRSAELASPWR